MAIRYLSGINVDSNTLFVDDVNNRVGIGTASPGSTLDVLGKVSINGDGTLNWGNAKDYGRLTWDTGKAIVRGESGKALSLGANGTQDYLYINTSGNVGIGTTGPTSLLHISGIPQATSGSMITIRDNDANGSNTSFSGVFFSSSPGTDYSIGKLSSGSDGLFQIRNGNNGTGYLTINNSGNVGIGTTGPQAKLHTIGRTKLQNDYFAEWRNVVNFAYDGTSVGGYVVTTPFAINSNYDMHITHVIGYGYGGETLIDFKVVYYAYISAPANYSIVDSGNDGMVKYLGKDSNGYVTICFGGLSDSNYFYRFNVNHYATRFPGNDYSSGWSISQTTSANYGMSALYALSPAITQRTSGNVGIGTTSPGYKLDVNGTGRFTAALAADSNIDLTGDLRYQSNAGFGLKSQNGTRLFEVYNTGISFVTALGGTSATFSSSVTASSLIKSGGTSSQYLMADGSVSTLTNPVTGTGTTNYVPKWTSGSAIGDSGIFDTSGNIVINGTTAINASSNRGNLTINGTSAILNFGISNVESGYIFHNGTNLDIAQVLAQPLRFLTTNAERMRIDASGNVGIGTAAPATKLEVYGGHNDSKFRIYSTGDGSGLDASLDMWASEPGVTYTGSGIGNNVNGQPYYGRRNSSLPQSYIRFYNGGILLNTGSTTASQTVTVLASGNVGIGTTSPSQKLHVVGAAQFDNVGTQLVLGTNGVAGAYEITTQTSNALTISLSGVAERMRIDASGNVGIGTTAPGAKLEIAQNTDNTDGPTLRIANNANTLSNGQLIGAIDFYNGDDSGTGNAVGAFIRSFTADAVLPVSSQYLSFAAGGTTERMRIASTGATRLNAYGSGSFTGTVAYNLAVDSSGNIIETAGGVVDGSGTANYVSKWSDANTLTDSVIYDNGTNVGIGTTSPAYKLDVSGSISNNGSINLLNTDLYPFFRIGPMTCQYPYNRIDSVRSDGSGYFWGFGMQEGSTNYVKAFFADGARGWYSADQLSVVTFNTNEFNGLYPTYTTGARILANGASYFNGGNVGIGTTSPSQKLHVVGNGLYTGNLDVGHSVSTEDAAINLGTGRTGNGFAYIDLIGDTTYTDYGLRILRNNGGANTTSLIVHRGTGDFSIQNNEAANLVFLTAATERMRITSAGNVGIGTTAPDSLLHISGSGNTFTRYTNTTSAGHYVDVGANGAGQSFVYSYGAYPLLIGTNGTTKMIVLSNGNVGIGTTSPSYKLDVYGDIRSGGADPLMILQPDSGTYAFFQKLSSSNGNYLRLYDGTNYSTFWKDGNVGIGTTAPGSKLSVSGSNTGSVPLVDLVASGSGAFQRGVRMLNSGMVAGDSIMYAAGRSDNSKNMGQFYFYYAGDGSNSNRISMGLHSVDDVFNINGSGNVGIGTTSPSQALHVSGNVRVTGAYYDSSNSAGSSGQVLSSTGSGTAWVNQGEATATSLYDLLPAARTTYAWSVQLTAGTWADIFSSNTVLSNGTWMVQVYVDDWAVGGQQYSETYSGIMSWGSASTTNQGGAEAISEVVLHRSGHAANAGNFYLRTVERVTSTLLLQGMSNQTYSAASTINFKFVKIF